MQEESITQERRRENRIRKLANRRGFSVHKSRQQLHCNNRGQFMLVDDYLNTIFLGENFDAALEEIEAYLQDEPTLKGG